MYSENNRRSATRRSDDEFLRRMMGGELTGNGFPVMNMKDMPRQPSRPIRDLPPRVSCAGDQNTATACPTQLSAPSLAMVYSPRQCWRKLLEPHEGLKAGTIFTELILPLEAVSKNGSKEVNTRRCL